ncbi:MAG: SDR family oxidoreductase [Bacteroidetes bacterium]|nr:SDR family oxidoreductase [Bacteroidota bacterium]
MNKIMVITGTSKGIGRELSQYYLKKGYTVIGCSRSESELLHERYEHFCLDVSDEKSVEKMITDVSRKYKKIDYLLNNAGIASMNHTLLTPASVVEKIFKVNVLGTFLFSREVAKVMSKNKWGRVVNFSTIGVPLRLEGECIYTSSKAAVEMMTRILAKEYAGMNITVNAVGPTPVKTDLIRNIPEDKITSLINRQAVKKMSDHGDIINVINFFINHKSNMVTGQVLYLGGLS